MNFARRGDGDINRRHLGDRRPLTVQVGKTFFAIINGRSRETAISTQSLPPERHGEENKATTTMWSSDPYNLHYTWSAMLLADECSTSHNVFFENGGRRRVILCILFRSFPRIYGNKTSRGTQPTDGVEQLHDKVHQR